MELFANPKAFIYLTAAAVLVAACWYFGARRRAGVIARLFSGENFLSLTPLGFGRARRRAAALFLSGLFMLFIALAAPQWGRQSGEVFTDYSQLIIAVDVSNSMLAQDFKADRLDAAKQMIDLLLNNIARERVGLIAFTSRAQLLCPVTTDYGAIKNLSRQMTVEMLGVQGTLFTPAVNLASKMLAQYEGKKALVFISDGEEHDDKDISAALKTARQSGIKIIAVGIGSPEGELIPQYVRTVHGLQREGFKNDKDGNAVLTKLNEQSLTRLANDTSGQYIKFSTPQTTADAVIANLSSLDKTSAGGARGYKYKNRYQWPLGLGVLLILASLLLPLRKPTHK